jgi:hypothetical protein
VIVARKRSIALTRGAESAPGKGKEENMGGKRSGRKAGPSAEARARKRAAQKQGLKVKDLEAKGGRKVRGGAVSRSPILIVKEVDKPTPQL